MGYKVGFGANGDLGGAELLPDDSPGAGERNCSKGRITRGRRKPVETDPANAAGRRHAFPWAKRLQKVNRRAHTSMRWVVSHPIELVR